MRWTRRLQFLSYFRGYSLFTRRSQKNRRDEEKKRNERKDGQDRIRDRNRRLSSSSSSSSSSLSSCGDFTLGYVLSSRCLDITYTRFFSLLLSSSNCSSPSSSSSPTTSLLFYHHHHHHQQTQLDPWPKRGAATCSGARLPAGNIFFFTLIEQTEHLTMNRQTDRTSPPHTKILWLCTPQPWEVLATAYKHPIGRYNQRTTGKKKA